MARVKIINEDKISLINVEKKALIADVLALTKHGVDMPCGKKGLCGKCTVLAKGEISPPSIEEKELLGAKLYEGYRLACKARIQGDCELEIPTCVKMNIRASEDEIDLNSPMFENYGMAVDIGTTTVLCSLFGKSGRLSQMSAKNPQLRLGADVISRIEAQINGAGERLQTLIIDCINLLCKKLCEKENIKPSHINKTVITGNTTMLHLLINRSCRALAFAPFKAEFLGGAEYKSKDLGLNSGGSVVLINCFSAFIGADIASAVLASGMTDVNETSLLVDIGTNGEMALFDNNKLYCCSTAAGPTFEGVGIRHGMHGENGAIEHVYIENSEIKCKVIGNSPPKGICGSGVVDAVAVLLLKEVIDETGFMDDCHESVVDIDGESFFELFDGIGIFAKDIRNVQLAKSAICAGVKTLIASAGLNYGQISRVYISGGFGSYLDLDHTAKIGLVPIELREKVKVIGNAALKGAEMLLCNNNLYSKIENITSEFKLVDLATSKMFNEHYVDNMFFK